jgi:hypothetical protein
MRSATNDLRLRPWILAWTSALSIVALSSTAGAAPAGKALFVAGPVTNERAGRTTELTTGAELAAGDAIATGAAARAQLLMLDGARIAMRANSRLRVDEMRLPSNVQRPGVAQGVADTGRSVVTLVSGGFRTRTGAVGAAGDRSGYQVRTPVGTLGIRGTDYTVVFCRADCDDVPGLAPGQPIRAGLYVKVDEGRVVFDGRGVSVEVAAPDLVFIPLEEAGPERLQDPPEFLRRDGAGALELAGRLGKGGSRGAIDSFNERRSPADVSASADANDSDNGVGDTQRPIDATSPFGRPVDLTPGVTPSQPRRDLGLAVPPTAAPGFQIASEAFVDQFVFDPQGALVGFVAPVSATPGAASADYRIGSATLRDVGANAGAELQWGRWAGGVATRTNTSGAANLDLGNRSLHYILGPPSDLQLALPISGSATYTLAGGTNPTDTLGNTGTLGAAFLSADFTNASVTTTLAATINNINWWATGSAPLTAGNNAFTGNFSNVLADSVVTGAGSFSGLFTTPLTGQTNPRSVGLTYQLTERTTQLGTIDGVAALLLGPGQPPPAPVGRRLIAYSIGNATDLENPTLDSEINTVAQVSTNAAGDVTGFVATYDTESFGDLTGTFSIGTSTNVNTGTNAALGLRWGRWTGGSSNVATPMNGTFTDSLAAQSLHWIVGAPYGTAPVVPTTGVLTTQLVGGTNPTDTRGNVGVIGAAGFTADFTNLNVAAAIDATITGRRWYGTGTGRLTSGNLEFGGVLQGNVQRLTPAFGLFEGYFVLPTLGGPTQRGAALSWYLSDALADAVNGALAFAESAQGGLPPAPAAESRDVAYTSASFFGAQQPGFAARNAATEYDLDGDFNLVRFTADFFSGNRTIESGEFAIGGAANSDFGASTVAMLRWGRWSEVGGGGAFVRPLPIGSPQPINLPDDEIGLHWITSADAATPPVLPQTGTANYSFVGGTTPRDSIGGIGVVTNATLNANFTSQTLSADLALDFGAYTVTATGNGVIGAQLGLPAHQFAGTLSGNYTSGALTQTATGQFVGFFSGPTSALQPAPPGAALSYSLDVGQLQLTIGGVAALQRP